MSGEDPKVETLIQLGTTLHKLMKERQQKFLTEKTVVQVNIKAKYIITWTLEIKDKKKSHTKYCYNP